MDQDIQTITYFLSQFPEEFYLVLIFSAISFVFGFLIGFVRIDRAERDKFAHEIEHGVQEVENYLSGMLKR